MSTPSNRIRVVVEFDNCDAVHKVDERTALDTARQLGRAAGVRAVAILAQGIEWCWELKEAQSCPKS